MDSIAWHARMRSADGHLAISAAVVPNAKARPGSVGVMFCCSHRSRYSPLRFLTATGSDSLTGLSPIFMRSLVCSE